jgi:hypothetical protein
MKEILLCLFVIIVGCKDSVKNSNTIEMFSFKGMTGKSEYMYFINPNEGYSFNNKTMTDWSKVTQEQLDDPNYFPKSTDKSTIYKTIDGGKNWEEITSITSRNFFNRALVFEDAIYIATNDFYNDKVFIAKFNISKDVLEFEKEYDVIGGIFTNGKNIFLQTEKGNSISMFNKDFSSEEKLYWGVGNESLSVNNGLYTILRNKNGHNYLQEYFNDYSQQINLIIEPEHLIKKSDSSLLIAGEKDNKTILLLSYDIHKKQTQVLKEFKGYSIVQGLQSNDKVICGFIGNISGMFTKYNLFYSLDNGKTWQIQELKEKSHVRPSALVDNILYILSGGNRMQKIVF